MLEPVRLELNRQLVVSNAVSESLAADRPVPILATTRARAEALLAAADQVRLFTGHTAKQVDHATDSVVVHFEKALEHHAGILRASVVPLRAAQSDTLRRLHLVRARLFPQGTGYIRQTMDLQFPALILLRDRMAEPEIAAAIDALGLRGAADHVLAHIALYARFVGRDVGSSTAGAEDAGAAWTAAFQLFAAQVLLDYQHDEAMRRELLGPYEAQVELQRAGYREEHRARKAAAAAAAAAATATATVATTAAGAEGGMGAAT